MKDRASGAPPSVSLTNGRLTTLVTAAGGGQASFGRYALTRRRPDRTRDADGIFLYVRDLEGRARWSAGLQPSPLAPDEYRVRLRQSGAELVRADDGVETATSIGVAPEEDVELRRYRFTNRGARARRLELTTYAEVVLNTAAGDAGHPAFSKLFVQTEWWAEAATPGVPRLGRAPRR